jgi:LCP family protein required for cell wall assembly
MIKYIALDDKQEKIKKTVKIRKGRFLLLCVFIIFIFLDSFLFFQYKSKGSKSLGTQLLEKVDMVIDSGSHVVKAIWEPELTKDNELTSALIVGIDSRNVEFNGTEFVNTKPSGQAGTRNTDTIMQIVYDHRNENVYMISIPRDMGVDVRKECLTFHGSIHWVYDKGQAAGCPGGGVQTLIDTVEGITGIKVQYYAFVTFEAFSEIINTVGDINEEGDRGIWIDIPKPVYELYPLGDTGWESVYFPKGYQFLTAERALKFARSREASSDFSRVRRQQMVIQAVKDKVVSTDTLLNPKTVYSLLNTFKKSVLFSEVSVDEIRAGLIALQSVKDTNFIHIVLDPELGGHEIYINKQPHDRPGGPYYMTPKQWKLCPGDEFCKVKEYLRKIILYPQIYSENTSIYVYARSYTSDWKLNYNNQTYQNFKSVYDLPVSLNESKNAAKGAPEGNIVIYDFSNGSKGETIKYLSERLGVEVRTGADVPKIRQNGEDIAIVVQGD